MSSAAQDRPRRDWQGNYVEQETTHAQTRRMEQEQRADARPAATTGLLETIKQDAEWARECLAADGFVGGRSTDGGDRALTYIERILKKAEEALPRV